MKIFHCEHCQHLVFFENTHCLKCEHSLAYLPDISAMAALEQSAGLWRRPRSGDPGPLYRLCANYAQEDVCNWALPAASTEALCPSCRLTRVIPDLDPPGHRAAWYRLETAKRRLVYSLLQLGLPIRNRQDDPQNGLAFEFLADAPDGSRVLTGHDDGVITINIAEADDAEREKRRLALHEPYRTLLGHFRHEVGHYYWDQLLARGSRLEGFRRLFGDERADYAAALQRHYQDGAAPDWQQRYLSTYASAHPWEDWAETWAHYLHMTDTLETAAASGLSLRPRRPDEPSLQPDRRTSLSRTPFATMMEDWFSLTYILNNLNRGLGLPDGYPFVLPGPAIDKLQFVHDTIIAANGPA